MAVVLLRRLASGAKSRFSSVRSRLQLIAIVADEKLSGHGKDVGLDACEAVVQRIQQRTGMLVVIMGVHVWKRHGGRPCSGIFATGNLRRNMKAT